MSTDHDRRGLTPRWLRRQTKKAAIVAGASVSAAALLGGGIAYATASSSGTVYSACLSRHSHATGRTGDTGSPQVRHPAPYH